MGIKNKTRKEYYKNYKVNKDNQKIIKDETIYQLFKHKKEPRKSQGVYNVPKEDLQHQMDLLYLPTDQKYKYLVVIVDVSSKEVDFEPVKNKNTKTIKEAIETIYRRNILNYPKMYISVDDGGEFKKHVADLFKARNIYMKVAKTNRHRQNSLAERANLRIVNLLFKSMTTDRLVSNEAKVGWVHKLDKLRKQLNKGKKAPSKEELEKRKNDMIHLNESNVDILQKGDKVRVKLDYPINLIDKSRLSGNFRAGDIRWSPEIKIISGVILTNGQPPFYEVDEDKTTHYTREQLQYIKRARIPNERVKKVVVEGVDKYIVEKILDKKKENRRVFYKIKWSNYDDSHNTWEPRTELIKDVPLMIKEFEQSIKK